MAELDYITVEGFRSIRSIEKLKLGPMTVLVGPNGSGKSNFLGVFSFLNAIRDGRLHEFVAKEGGADKVLHFGSRTTRQLHISISFEDGRNQYELTLEPTRLDGLIPRSETVYYKSPGFSRPYDETLTGTAGEAGISNAFLKGVGGYVRQRLDRWRLYHFHDTSDESPMKKTADVHDNRYLRPDGSNLAAFLYLLNRKQEMSYGTIVRTVRQVAPFFRDFELEPNRLNRRKVILEWEHEGTDDYFDAASLSDGTLRFMALATLFLQPKRHRPSVILVDEPELGMHPYAITLLASLMKQASNETQVIVSTQSSLLLDHFEPEDVLVADRADGATQLKRLESSGLGSWLEDYSLGQLWEKNVLGGRPRRE